MKTKTKKLMESIIRTIWAIGILLIGTECFLMAINWHAHMPIDNVSVVLTLALYFEALVLIPYGIYMISPIYVSEFVHKFANRIIDKVTINKDYDYEYGKEIAEKKFQNKLFRLKKKYLW